MWIRTWAFYLDTHTRWLTWHPSNCIWAHTWGVRYGISQISRHEDIDTQLQFCDICMFNSYKLCVGCFLHMEGLQIVTLSVNHVVFFLIGGITCFISYILSRWIIVRSRPEFTSVEVPYILYCTIIINLPNVSV